MKSYTVTIEGTAPLLMHRFDEIAQAQLSGEVKKTKGAKETPAEQAERAAYRLENGNLYLPAEALYNALVKSAAGLKVTGGRGKTYKASAQGNLNITPEYIDLGVKDYAIDTRTARIQRTACLRSRPRLDKWRATFTVELFDEDLTPKEVLAEMIATAGQQVGVLDYRPRFGRFMVTRFEEVG